MRLDLFGIAFCVLWPLLPTAQSRLSAFVDYRDEFILFEDFYFRRLDFLPPKSFQIGGNAIAFIDHRGDFKIYQNGQLQTPLDASVHDYLASASMVFFRTPGGAYVWDQGRLHLLTRFLGKHMFTDSLVAFLDEVTRDFHVYTRGRSRLVVRAASVAPAVRLVTAASNLVAYQPFDGMFEVFWNENVYTLPHGYPVNSRAGTNILAYTDQYEPGLFAFYKGEVVTLEAFTPVRFQAGNDMVAWVSRDESFRLFYQGQIIDLGNYVPDLWHMAEDIFLYSDQLGQTHLFYQGQSLLLENHLISQYQAAHQSLSYTDRNGRVKFVTRGQRLDLPWTTYYSARLDYDVLQLSMQNRSFRLVVGQSIIDY